MSEDLSEKQYPALLAESAKASNAAYEKQWGKPRDLRQGVREFNTRSRREGVLAFVLANPGLSTVQVAEGLKMKRSTCFEDLSALRVNGKVQNQSPSAYRPEWVAVDDRSEEPKHEQG